MGVSEFRRVAARGQRIASVSSLAERMAELHHRLEYRRMIDFEDREAVQKLRHSAYQARHGESLGPLLEKAIEPADELNAVTVGVFLDRKLCGSMKVTAVSRDYPNAPCRKMFPGQVDQLFEADKVVLDPGRFVSDPTIALQVQELPWILIKIPIMACQYFPADECLTHVSSEHAAFYKRIFRSEQIAGPQYFPELRLDAVLLTNKIDEMYNDVLERFPFWRSTFLEMRQIFGPLNRFPALKSVLTEAA